MRGRFCTLHGAPRLWAWVNPEYSKQRVMVIAPHADDAELAAFGLYSRAEKPWIVTLTAGEIEAEHYQQMGLDPVEASRTKGRLRAWDSIAVPLWAGVPQAHCVQLGYFCLQLPAMRATPDQPVASREAELSDIRLFRQFNPFPLPADVDGLPTWNNLLADLRQLLLTARPEVIVLPHPLLDPHPDHICAQQAVVEALQGLDGSRPSYWVTPTICMTTTAGPWVTRAPVLPCRRCSTIRLSYARAACHCRWRSSVTKPWRWA